MKTKSFLSLFYKSRMGSVILFSVALMILVFSCPVKKWLSGELLQSSAAQTGTNNSPDHNGNFRLVNHSCSVKKTTDFSEYSFSKKIEFNKQFPFTNAFNYAGLSNDFYLLGTGNFVPRNTSVSSSLPLFLRHLRLLI